MKSIFIVANWKSNKTVAEAEIWLESFKPPVTDRTVIICAPFTLLHLLHERKSGFELGAQDVSPFGEGAFTGAINARQLKELVSWVLIGHSERRKYFGETDETLAQKVTQAKAAGLRVLYCVQDEKTPIPGGVEAVAYEPVWAIGTGKTDTPPNANGVITAIKKTSNVPIVLYGGSVSGGNIASFVSQPSIDGVLVGGGSLDPDIFVQILANAAAS